MPIYAYFDAPDVAELLLDLPNGLEISSTVERVSAHEEELDEVACDVAAGDVESSREVWKREAVVYGHNMSNTISRVYDYSGSQAYKVGLYNVNQPVSTYTESHTLRV